jgi:hypothetical protein
MKLDFLVDGWGVIARWTVRYALFCCRLFKRRRQITSARDYVRLCRRLYPDKFGYDLIDGRLVGTAWNFLSPCQWAEEIDDFLRYWNGCAGRPGIVGSSYNPDPQMAFGSW